MEIRDVNSPKQLSPLVLAFLGDSVFELMVREKIVAEGNAPVGKLHHKAVHYVCAGAQAEAFRVIEPLLSEEEMAVFKRGRNAKSQPPKNADPLEYRAATGLEALFGYLYAAEQHERTRELFELIWTSAQK